MAELRQNVASRPQPEDESNLSWSPMTRDDITSLAALLTAIELLDEPSERHSVEALYEAFDESGADPTNDALLGRDAGGTLVAYGWNHPGRSDTDPRRVYIDGGVHPGWRRQGIGSALLRYQLEHARRWHTETRTDGHGPLRVIAYVDEKLTERRALYERHGLDPLRWYADMSITFEGEPPSVPDPPGIELVPFTMNLSEAVREAHNEAFADHWGAQPVDPERWEQQTLRSDSRPEWSWVAVDAETGDVAGYAMNAAYEQDWESQGYSEGWTDRIGVRRAWRGRSIAKALLCWSMATFAKAGLEAAGLGVDSDNPTGAFQLYESLGYQAGETMVMHALTE